MANAEADSLIVRAKADIEVQELQERALTRFVSDQMRQQENLETVINEAAVLLNDDASPADIDNDWLANLFDKCKNISNEQMRLVFARIFAGQANINGSFLKI